MRSVERTIPQQQACPLGGDTAGAPPARGAPPAPAAPVQSSFSGLQEASRWSQHLPKAAQEWQKWLTLQKPKNLLSMWYFFPFQTLIETVNHQTTQVTIGNSDVEHPHIYLHAPLNWHMWRAHSWRRFPFLLSHALSLFHSICVGTDMRCGRRRGCSLWSRPSSRPHTDTSNPPVRTAPPPASWTRKFPPPSPPDLCRETDREISGVSLFTAHINNWLAAGQMLFMCT